MANVGRNDPCPCGSGEKYKRCCEGKVTQSQKLWRGLAALIALLVILVTIGILRGGSQAEDAPPGRVWSPEHGHWHDATGTAPQ
ncbi:MAG TPA: SEC-C metal-binding domain-containing protein [Acidobacteriota bacterium]|nr:SEC-C metal-binding domain-containing protein [Acidobacteriota bacterium]